MSRPTEAVRSGWRAYPRALAIAAGVGLLAAGGAGAPTPPTAGASPTGQLATDQLAANQVPVDQLPADQSQSDLTQAVLALTDSLDGERYGRLQASRAIVRFAASDSLVAVRVVDHLDQQRPLPGLPDSLPAAVIAVLAHSPVAFDEITGGVVPEWRAGVAIPAQRMLVMPAGEGRSVLDAEGLRTLRHEWAHLGLHAYLGDLRAPRWFDEGYAQWASGGFDVMEAWRLRVLLATDDAPPMDSLELRWPAGREQARVAYLLAASAVSYLLESGGERGLALFLDRWREARSFDTAFRSTFGVTPNQFEEDWKRHVRRRYGWLFVLSHSSVFWSMLALVLLFMVSTRRNYNREKMARMRATEPPDDPAYWKQSTGEGGPGEPPSGV